jgi:anti-anti-sigma factor
MSEPARVREPPFKIVVERQDDGGCIALFGGFEAAFLPQLEEELLQARRGGIRHLIFDLRGLTAIDREGLNDIVAAWTRNGNDGSDLILVRMPTQLRKLVEECGIDQLLPIAYNHQMLSDGQGPEAP